jgi:hypothetical protein
MSRTAAFYADVYAQQLPVLHFLASRTCPAENRKRVCAPSIIPRLEIPFLVLQIASMPLRNARVARRNADYRAPSTVAIANEFVTCGDSRGFAFRGKNCTFAACTPAPSRTPKKPPPPPAPA